MSTRPVHLQCPQFTRSEARIRRGVRRRRRGASDKVEEREQKWTIELPDKTVGRLQLVGAAGAFLGSFVVGPAYALFWDAWDESQRTAWSLAAAVVGLMTAIPIVVLYTRRRRRY